MEVETENLLPGQAINAMDIPDFRTGGAYCPRKSRVCRADEELTLDNLTGKIPEAARESMLLDTKVGSIFAVQFLQDLDSCMRCFLILGGVGTLPGFDTVFPVCWFSSFLLCTGLCFANMVIYVPPFASMAEGGNRHQQIMLMVIVYTHVICAHSVFFWRRFARSAHFVKLVRSIDQNDSSAETAKADENWKADLRLIGRIGFAIQLLGYVYIDIMLALPALIAADSEHFDSYQVFNWVHGLVMLFVNLLVITSALLSPLMFAIVAVLHYRDAERVRRRVYDHNYIPDISGDLRPIDPFEGTLVWDSLPREVKIELTIASVVNPFVKAQDRLTRCCETWEFFYVHLAFFAAFILCGALVGIFNVDEEIAAHSEKEVTSKYFAKYGDFETHMWYWTMIDLILIVVAIIILCSCFLGASIVTRRFRQVSREITFALLLRRVPLAVVTDTNIDKFLERIADGWTFLGMSVTASALSGVAGVALSVVA